MKTIAVYFLVVQLFREGFMLGMYPTISACEVAFQDFVKQHGNIYLSEYNSNHACVKLEVLK